VGSVSVTVRFPGLKDSKGLRKKAKKHKVKKLAFKISVTSASGGNTGLTLTIKKPR
jgi:hypothetical protein